MILIQTSHGSATPGRRLPPAAGDFFLGVAATTAVPRRAGEKRSSSSR